MRNKELAGHAVGSSESPNARAPQQPKADRRKSRSLSGILLLDKRGGLSSNAALQKVRHLFRAAKAGHTGSLDPLATGLLPICFGEATKIAGLLLGSGKAYETVCVLGVNTDTDDVDGAIVRTRAIPPLDESTINAALQGLTGLVRQTAPIYSALKQAGVPLYRRARRGEEVVAPVREVEVRRFDLIARDGAQLRLHVECGSGTYVRSLVRDLGEQLGCGAHVIALRRLWVDPFTQPRMVTLDALAALDEAERDALILPLEAGLVNYPRIVVDTANARRLRQGQVVSGDAMLGELSRAVAVDGNGRAVALVESGDSGGWRCVRGFVDE